MRRLFLISSCGPPPCKPNAPELEFTIPDKLGAGGAQLRIGMGEEQGGHRHWVLTWRTVWPNLASHPLQYHTVRAELRAEVGSTATCDPEVL